jgi:hypothetical protein
MIQVTKLPKDLEARLECPLGSRFFINKKKYPYLFKLGRIRIKTDKKIITLYEDEVEIIIVK